MTKTTEEKVALVTGSAMGIGLACAEAFAKAGYITVLADIREPGEQVEKLVAEGHKAVAYRCGYCCYAGCFVCVCADYEIFPSMVYLRGSGEPV